MINNWEISGKIISGAKQGAYFTQLDWVQIQCQQKLGFRPYPGTLNLEIATENAARLETGLVRKGIELVSPESNYCSGAVIPLTVDGIACALVAPAEEVRLHPRNIIEIISRLGLKDALDVDDGDWVTVMIESPL